MQAGFRSLWGAGTARQFGHTSVQAVRCADSDARLLSPEDSQKVVTGRDAALDHLRLHAEVHVKIPERFGQMTEFTPAIPQLTQNTVRIVYTQIGLNGRKPQTCR